MGLLQRYEANLTFVKVSVSAEHSLSGALELPMDRAMLRIARIKTFITLWICFTPTRDAVLLFH